MIAHRGRIDKKKVECRCKGMLFEVLTHAPSKIIMTVARGRMDFAPGQETKRA